MSFAYLFETRGIQRFLFASGRLRDALGGSELLDYISAPGGYLDQVLDKLAFETPPERVRNAGGVFYLVFANRSDAERFRDAWRLASAHWLPGVERVDALAEGSGAQEAVRKGINALRTARNRMSAELPTPGPLSERAPRTGLAAILRDRGESLDAATAGQRNFKREEDTGTLASRFSADAEVTWPNTFDPDGSGDRSRLFPLRRNRLIGIIHADGNGLGQLLRKLNEACKALDDATYINIYRSFSDGLTQATQAAARRATEQVLAPRKDGGRMPARPLVLGGDDLSIIVRDDLAVPYAEAFLRAFEEETAKTMAALKAEYGLDELPGHLTACAGIAWVKCSSPFGSASELAEALCSQAKKASSQLAKDGTSPASIAFFRLDDSLVQSLDVINKRALCVREKDGLWHLALPAYGLDETSGLPTISGLRAVLAALEESTLNDRPLRNLATLLHADLDEARQAYARWRQIGHRQASDGLKKFDEALMSLLAPIGTLDSSLPFAREKSTGEARSPLADVLTLLHVSTRKEPSLTEKEDAA